MALSNWDCLAVSFAGEQLGGEFVSPLGVKVQIYKNWLYISDAKAWEPGGAFAEHTVMQLNHGQVVYKDVNILALRGPQDGVYAVVWTGYVDVVGMVGCGVYGYRETEWIGLLPESLTWFREQLTGGADVEYSTTIHGADGDETVTEVGFAHTHGVPKQARTALTGGAQRFNAGDKYFADALGVELELTAPGEAGKPVLEQLIAEQRGADSD